ncbi:peptidoglycan-binding cell wall degradation protein, partial [Brevibacterium paucivorans]
IARDSAGGEDVRDVLTAIVDMNGLDSSTVHPGQRILVPSR